MLEPRPSLRVIHGGRYRHLRLGLTRVVVTERPYRSPDAVLFEENTALNMSGAGTLDATQAGTPSTHRGGSVIVRPGTPAELLLIVNRAGSRTGFRPGWLESAWDAALQEADQRRLSFLVAPLVGCIGGAKLEVSLSAVAGVLSLRQYQYPRTLELACGDLAEQAYAGLAHYAHHLRN